MKREQNILKLKAEMDEKRKQLEEEEQKHLDIRDAKHAVKKPLHEVVLGMEQREMKYKAKWVRNQQDFYRNSQLENTFHPQLVTQNPVSEKMIQEITQNRINP